MTDPVRSDPLVLDRIYPYWSPSYRVVDAGYCEAHPRQSIVATLTLRPAPGVEGERRTICPDCLADLVDDREPARERERVLREALYEVQARAEDGLEVAGGAERVSHNLARGLALVAARAFPNDPHYASLPGKWWRR